MEQGLQNLLMFRDNLQNPQRTAMQSLRDLDEGNELIFMDKIVPDYDINTGNVKFSVKTKRYPESQEVTEKGPFTISNTTEKISMRARGRQARIRVSCDSTGTSWRWGSLRMALQKDGGR